MGLIEFIHRNAKKTIEVDSKIIDLAIEELSKLMDRLDKNPKKTRMSKIPLRRLKRYGRHYRILFFMLN